jgi:cytochrome c oxidase subunit 2
MPPVLPPWVSDPAGPAAREIVPVYWIMFAAAVLVLAIVYGVIFYAGIRYRERPGVVARQFHGHNLLELLWTVIPTIIVVAFSILSFQRLLVLNDVDTGADMTIKVTGRQWTFEFEYPREYKGVSFVTREGPLPASEELHIPVNTKVRLEMTATDVIHSFSIPNLGGKMDLIPGRKTYLALQADRTGTFKGQCYEFCGEGHADMLLRVVVHETSDFAAWAKTAVEDYNRRFSEETKAGRELFKSLACAGCHTIDGLTSGKVAPGRARNLTKVASNPDIAAVLRPVNEENLKRWIKDPPAVKPGTAMPNLGLDDDTINKIVQFLLTQK